jgi:hypothetical protein
MRGFVDLKNKKVGLKNKKVGLKNKKVGLKNKKVGLKNKIKEHIVFFICFLCLKNRGFLVFKVNKNLIKDFK